MAEVLSEDERLKALFKTALLEVVEECRDLLRDVIEETLEDIALARHRSRAAHGGSQPQRGVLPASGRPLSVRFEASFATDVRALEGSDE